jgi:hypothetical protein
MISIRAKVADLVEVQAGIIAITGVMLHGLPGSWQNTQPSLHKGTTTPDYTFGTSTT